jgi:uncharacterized membrane protein
LDLPIIKLNITDKIFEAAGWLAVLAIWVLTISAYSKLPEIIPIHYNGAGEADGFGGKKNILALPIVSTILFVGLTILNKFPQVFNYPADMTEETALTQYTGATRFIRCMKFIVVIIFGAIAFETIQNQNGNEQDEGLGIWFLPLTLGLIFIPLAYSVIRSLISRRKEKK